MNKIVISNIYRRKDKQSFFALHQIITKIKSYKPTCEIHFHILWDDSSTTLTNEIDWSNKIYKLLESNDVRLYEYNKDFFKNYCKEFYFVSDEIIKKFDNFLGIYFILMAHYLRRSKLENYYLIYDDDIIINNDFHEVIDCILTNTPCLISEPMNCNCDKVLFRPLYSIYGDQLINVYKVRNPYNLGFNAGFQGIDLSIYDDFLSVDVFNMLLSLFNLNGVYDANGKEIWGPERSAIDTQQQSFFGIMNIVKSRNTPFILNPNEYFVIPNWGVHPVYGEINNSDENDGWTFALRSKIVHFIGHTQGKGKPKKFLNMVDEYLLKHNITV